MDFPDKNGWTAEDYKTLIVEANKADFRPEHYLAVTTVESGLAEGPITGTKAYNKNGGARGLNQMMPKTLYNLGYRAGEADFDASAGEYRNLSVSKQLVWSGKYFQDVKKWTKIQSFTSPGDLYLANFLPAYLKHKDRKDWVLAKDPDIIYVQNKGFDRDKKGWITIEDVNKAAYRGAVSVICARAIKSLNAVRQEQLNIVAPGTEKLVYDGEVGPKTRAAINEFCDDIGVPHRSLFDAVLDMALFGVS